MNVFSKYKLRWQIRTLIHNMAKESYYISDFLNSPSREGTYARTKTVEDVSLANDSVLPLYEEAATWNDASIKVLRKVPNIWHAL